MMLPVIQTYSSIAIYDNLGNKSVLFVTENKLVYFRERFLGQNDLSLIRFIRYPEKDEHLRTIAQDKPKKIKETNFSQSFSQ